MGLLFQVFVDTKRHRKSEGLAEAGGVVVPISESEDVVQDAVGGSAVLGNHGYPPGRRGEYFLHLKICGDGGLLAFQGRSEDFFEGIVAH